MNYILTLVAADNSFINKGYEGIASGSAKWIVDQKVLEIEILDKPPRAFMDDLRKKLYCNRIDVFITPSENRVKKLLLADMDATIVSGETLDELGAAVNLKDQIAQITQRAMAGEIDFKQALDERVALLRGLSEDALADTLNSLELNKGAIELVSKMKANGSTCILVSGGFTFFTNAIAQKVGFDKNHGNTLEIVDGALTGAVIPPILDKNTKLNLLNKYIKELGISAQDTMTIGDGANDIPMLLAAGLGVGYKPKPAVQKSVDNMIIHGNLDAALYAQGI